MHCGRIREDGIITVARITEETEYWVSQANWGNTKRNEAQKGLLLF